ncbi:hypothetical protein [Mucilaginibacter flavus]|uniref:hypothetical protein n=1 Tax=Mucilaginibacter flavus TaxID=931504 RepID=UPI0025B43EE2|nr:hypothetical protein [Mucilaginibacter flavus]MDN3582089.1 hypothetical protein [Mucilaginibacter flavus]
MKGKIRETFITNTLGSMLGYTIGKYFFPDNGYAISVGCGSGCVLGLFILAFFTKEAHNRFFLTKSLFYFQIGINLGMLILFCAVGIDASWIVKIFVFLLLGLIEMATMLLNIGVIYGAGKEMKESNDKNGLFFINLLGEGAIAIYLGLGGFLWFRFHSIDAVKYLFALSIGIHMVTFLVTLLTLMNYKFKEPVTVAELPLHESFEENLPGDQLKLL